MKATTFIIFILVICSCIYAQKKLKVMNTKWVSILKDSVCDYIVLNRDNTYMEYSCELMEKYFGNYSIINDTLVLEEFKKYQKKTISSERKNLISLSKYILKDNKLTPVFYQYKEANGKWSKPKLEFDHSYYFIQDKKNKRH